MGPITNLTGYLLASNTGQEYQLSPQNIMICNNDNNPNRQLLIKDILLTQNDCLNDSVSYIEFSFSDKNQNLVNIIGLNLVLDWYSDIKQDGNIYYQINGTYIHICNFEVPTKPQQSICDLSTHIQAIQNIDDATIRIEFVQKKESANLITGNVLRTDDTEQTNETLNGITNKDKQNSSLNDSIDENIIGIEPLNESNENITIHNNLENENDTNDNLNIENTINNKTNTTTDSSNETNKNITNTKNLEIIDNITNIENITNANVAQNNSTDEQIDMENNTVNNSEVNTSTEQNITSDEMNTTEENNVINNKESTKTTQVQPNNETINQTQDSDNNLKQKGININSIFLEIQYENKPANINLYTNKTEINQGETISFYALGNSQIIKKTILSIDGKDIELEMSSEDLWEYKWTVPINYTSGENEVTIKVYSFDRTMINSSSIILNMINLNDSENQTKTEVQTEKKTKETVSQRGQNFDKFENRDGTYTTYIGKLKNYYNRTEYITANTMITSEPQDELEYDYGVENNTHKTYFKQDPLNLDAIKFKFSQETINKTNPAEGYVTYQPISLNYRNSDGYTQEINKTQPIIGVEQGDTFVYPNIFGNNYNLTYTVKTDKLEKNLILDQKPTQPHPDVLAGNNITLDMDFLIDYTANLDIYINDALWDKKSTIETTKKILFKEQNTENTLFYMQKPYAYDNEYDYTELKYQLKKQGNSIFITIKTPYMWLNDPLRAYPVNIDPTTDIGYEYVESIYHLWNTYDSYYVNLTNGFQITNDQYAYWGYTSYCARLKSTVWYQYCIDDGTWEWIATTDNITYTNLTGFTTFKDKNNRIEIALEYYLETDWREILVTPTITNVGNNEYSESEITVINYNIRINTTYENDTLELSLTSGLESYNISDPALSLLINQDNLTTRSFELWDRPDELFARTRWNESYFLDGQQYQMNYTLNVTHTSEWYNAPVILTLQTGILNKQNKITTNIWWIDAAPAPPVFTVTPKDNPDPVLLGNTVTFNATATDINGDTWYLAICKTDAVTGGLPPTCDGGAYCVSSSTVADGSENTCTWVSTGSGAQNWYAFACDDSVTKKCTTTGNTVNSPITVNIKPKTNQTTVNATTVSINTEICINHTITIESYPISSTWIEIKYPNGTSSNISTSNSTGVCGSGGSIYGVVLNVGSTGGTLSVNTSWVNDTQGYIDYDDPYPNIEIDVVSPLPTNIIIETYRDSNYLYLDKLFTINDTIFIDTKVTNQAGNVTDGDVILSIINNTDDIVNTINLTYSGSGSSRYYGNWTSQITDAPGIYTIKINATNPYGSLIENTTIHIYSGSNVSAYKLDYDADNTEDYIIEGENLIIVYNGTINTTQAIIFLENKELNESYNIETLSDNTLFGLGDIVINNMVTSKYTSKTFSQEGENLAEIELDMQIEYRFVPDSPTEETLQNDDGAASSFYTNRFIGDTIACKFTASTTNYPYKIMSTNIQLYDINTVGSTVYIIHIYEDNEGVPGNNLIQPFNTTITSFYSNWATIDLSSYNIEITSGNFWIGVELTENTGDSVTGGPFFLDDGAASPPTNSYFDFGSGWEVQSGGNEFMIRSKITTVYTTTFNITVKIINSTSDYLNYRIHNFDENITNINSLFPIITGTLGSSAIDDNYALENGSTGLITDLPTDQWTDYSMLISNYSLIFDNSITEDSTNTSFISLVRFNESENITISTVGFWNDSTNDNEGLRLEYNPTSASSTDEINYLLVFTKGDYSTLNLWMPTIHSGIFPQPNIMTDIFPPIITIVYPNNDSNIYTENTWIWLNITTDTNANCQWNDTISDFEYGTGTDFEIGQETITHAYNYTSISNKIAYNFWYKCNDTIGNINTEATHHHFFNSDNITISLNPNKLIYAANEDVFVSGFALYEGSTNAVIDQRVNVYLNDSLMNNTASYDWKNSTYWVSGTYVQNQTMNNTADQLATSHMMYPYIETLVSGEFGPDVDKNIFTAYAKSDWGISTYNVPNNGFYHDFETPPDTINYTFYFNYSLFQTKSSFLDRHSRIVTFVGTEGCNLGIFTIYRYEGNNHLYVYDGICNPSFSDVRNTAYSIDTGVVISDNTEYKVNVLFDGTTWTIYVNDVLEETIDNAGNPEKNSKVTRITHSAYALNDDYYPTNITVKYTIQYNENGTYDSDLVYIPGTLLTVKPVWYATIPTGTNFTVFVSTENNVSWCEVYNDTLLESGCGLGIDNTLQYRINFTTDNIWQTAEINNITFAIEYGPRTNYIGYYNITFNAPTSNGAYIIKTNITDEDSITGENSTIISVSSEPIIGAVECYNSSSEWGICNYSYYENITQIRVNCTADGGQYITNATYLVKNIIDDTTFLNANNATSTDGDWWIYTLPSGINITDSGQWNITGTCINDDTVSKSNQTSWFVPWGHINVELVTPTIPTNVSQNEFFTFESKITCLDGECGQFNATLDPEQKEDKTESIGPVFIDTKLWPKSVINNDTMHFDIRAKDSQGIVLMTIDMGGIETITLNLTDGTIYEGQWIGTWIVHDALTIEYNATITAFNSLGYYNEIKILWEDPIRIGDTMHAELFVNGAFYDLDNKITANHDSLLGDMTFGDSSAPYGGWGSGTATNIRNHITGGSTAVNLGIVDYDSIICNKTDGRTYGNIDYFAETEWVSCWKTNDSNYFKVITLPDSTYINSQWGWYGTVTDLAYAPPVIETNQTYPYQPIGGNNITINTIVSDYNRPGIEWVNFTLINPLGTKVINNENGTMYYNSSLWTTYWNSSYYVIDMIGTWNVSILAGDGDGNTTFSSWTFDVTTKVISMTVGARPFYTTSDNPQDGLYSNCLSDMRAGDECTNNWTVNATGLGDTTWEFFVDYNATTYRAYITDNVTETVNITIKDVTAPLYSLNQTDSTSAGIDVLFSLYWSDSALSGYIFSFDNGTGTFVNDSYVNMTGTGNWSNVSKWVNSTVGATIRWQVYANDTSGNMNSTEILYFTYETQNSISTQITKILSPDIIVSDENETINVTTTIKINSTQNEVYSINITDEIPYDFYNSTSITVNFKNYTTAEITEITTGLNIEIIDLIGTNNTQIQVNITNMSLTNIGSGLDENDSIEFKYLMVSAKLTPGENRTMYTNASVIDINENINESYITKTIMASEAVLRGTKYIWINPVNPQNITVTIIIQEIGLNPMGEILIADFLPNSATINNKNITYYNASTDQTYQFLNDSDYYLGAPGSDTLPDGVLVDIYHYNFTYNYTNWDGLLYNNDTITIIYNATILGGGSWLLPTIIGGYDPSYQQHIRTEMYTDVNIPLFDIIVDIITRTVTVGNPVMALLTMENMGGPKAKVDVVINYAIKTMSGKLITESTDTIAVVDKKERTLSLYLPESTEKGMYTFEAFVTYTGREAISTRTFEVKDAKEVKDKSGSFDIDRSLILDIIILLTIIYLIWKQSYKSKKDDEKTNNPNNNNKIN